VLNALICFFFGHRWALEYVRGDNGEPGGNLCIRCTRTEPNYALPCRCLGETYYPLDYMPCQCEFNGFVAEV
jgi:hypothetical protein